jgi:hypothetical protein
MNLYIGNKKLTQRIKELEEKLKDFNKIHSANDVMGSMCRDFQKVQKQRNLDAVDRALQMLSIDNLDDGAYDEAQAFLETFFDLCREEILYLNREEEKNNEE